MFVVKQSLIGAVAGKGVFAARDFKRGDPLTYYGGVNLGKAGDKAAEEALQSVYAERPADGSEPGRYVLQLNGSYIKAPLTNKNPAHMINDAGGKHANAKCGGGGLVEVKKGKSIAAGQEIYWCYHAGYWSRWGPRRDLPTTEEGRGGRARGRTAGRSRGSRGGRSRGGRVALGADRVLRQRVEGRASGTS